MALACYAQKIAVTETGEEVLLYEDGTWNYVNYDDAKKSEIPTNPAKFSRNKKSTFLLKSKTFNVGFWLDPKKWSFQKGTDNPDAEYEIKLKDGDLYGVIITEKLEIPLPTMKNIALQNSKAIAPDMQIISEEYRTVNNLKVLQLHMKGSMQGIRVSYYSYYFSNENGTVQFVTFTAQNLFDEYKNDIDELLNGLVELE